MSHLSSDEITTGMRRRLIERTTPGQDEENKKHRRIIPKWEIYITSSCLRVWDHCRRGCGKSLRSREGGRLQDNNVFQTQQGT